MIDAKNIWREQCRAALHIREDFGLEKALGYLIGEKLADFIRASDRDPGMKVALEEFILEIKRIFDPDEIRAYLNNIRRIGPLGHVFTDEEFEEFRSAGAVGDGPVDGAEDILIVERIKEMLVGD
jgi:hypothetical protein